MPKKLRAATAAEAVRGLKAVETLKAAEPSAVSSLQGYKGSEAWGSIAYLSMCERTGSALRLHVHQSTASLESDGSIEILGGGYGPWPPQRGIGGEFEAPSSGTYACTVRLSRPPNFVGDYQFAIDGTVLGIGGIAGGSPNNLTFVVRLGPGIHIFWVREFSVTFWFYSLTVLRIPELAPA
jgi:hypothetical protein